MVTQGNRKKRVVWQDIRPAGTFPSPVIKKPTRLQKIKNKLTKLSKKIKLVGLLVCIVVLAIGGYYIVKIQPSARISTSNTTKTTSSKPVLERGTPSYLTILPTGKNISQLGGWTRVSPPNSEPAYAYTDKINNIPIIVDQQPLPSDFKDDTAQKVKQLAQGFNANSKITVGDTIIYIGTSSNGPQSIIFTKNNLLILIKSDDKITNDDWAKYISSLQ